MKIKTQLVVTMILCCAMLLIVAAAVLVTNRRVEHLNAQAEIVHWIERDVSNLSYLTNDYLLFRESQQRTRWETKFSSFSANMSKLKPDDLEQQAVVDNIERSRQRLQAVFANVVATLADRSQSQDDAAIPAIIQVSWSRIAVQNQGIVFDAHRLEQLLHNQIDGLKRQRSIFIAALLVLFGAYFLANYLIVYRRTLKSIFDLKAGTEIIGSGNLDHVVQVQHADEIGELTHAFNRMTANLKHVTASKTDLEKEMAERRKAEEEVRQQREWLHVTLSSIGDAVIATDTAGRITFINPIAAGLTGWAPEEALGRPIQSVVRTINEMTGEPGQDIVQCVLTEGCIVQMANHTTLVTRTGEQVPIEDSAAPIKDGAGNLIGAVLVFRDVTEKRRAQDSLHEGAERLRIVADFPYDWEYWRSMDNRFLYVSPSCERITGYAREEFIEDPGLMLRIVHPDDRERVSTHMREDLFFDEACELEFRILRRDGEERWIGHVCQPVVDAQSRLMGRRTSNRDITDRKQAEDALRCSEERYRGLFETMNEGFSLHEVICNAEGRPCDYRFLNVNPAFERQTGLKAENLIGRTVREVLPETEPYWIERFGQVALTGQSDHFEQWSQALERWYQVSAFQTSRWQFGVVFLDVTRRKAAEERIEQENREMALLNRILRSFTESAGDELFDQVLDIVREGLASRHGVFGYMAEPGHLICPSLTKMLDACEVEGKCIHYPPEKWKGLWARALREKRSFYVNKPQPVPTGHPAIGNNLAAPILFQGEAIGLLNLANKDGGYTESDRLLLETMAARIAPLLYAWIQKKLREDERAKAEEELRRQREWLQVTLSSIGDAVIATDVDARITFMNPVAEDLTGWRFGEASQKPVTDVFHIINEQTRKVVDSPVYKVLLEGSVVGLANHTMLIRKDGTEIAVDDSGAPIKDGTGNLLGVILVFRDITERRRDEEVLRQAHQRSAWLAQFPEQNPNPVVRVSADGIVLYCNPASAKVSGWTCQVGQLLQDQLRPVVDRAFAEGRELRQDLELGERIWMLNVTPFPEERFATIYFSDMTDRNRAEAALRSSEQLYRELVQNANSAIIRWKSDGTITFFNEYAQKFFGYNSAEVIGKHVGIIVPETETTGADLRHLVNDIVKNPEHFVYQINENMCRDGRRVWMSWTNKPIFDENGKVLEILAVGSDFTQVKRIEQMLKRSSERFKLLSNTAERLLATNDPRETVEDLCREVMAHLDCQTFFNFLVDEVAGRLHLNACAGIPEEEIRKIEWLDYGVAVCGCAARDGERIITENIGSTGDPRTERIASYGIRAYACHPLIAHDRVIGTLSFGTRTRDRFQPEELALMKTVVDQVATAMDRRRILHELRRSRDILEMRVQERTVELEKRARQLSLLASELTLVEDRERRRLAGILHDNLQQLLVAAKMNIEILSGSVGTDQRPAVENILDLITQSIKVSRSLTDELSPPLLKHYGLAASLKWLGRWVQEMHGLKVDLSVDPLLDPKQMDHTVLLFQSVRELLFNVVKHSGVITARVEMRKDADGGHRIVVSDQGVGLDSKIIWEHADAGAGFGLFSIRERMMLMGGRLEVESRPGMGASFSLVLPPEKKEAADEKFPETEANLEKPHAGQPPLSNIGDKIRVMLVDDHEVVRNGLSTLLGIIPDMEVVGESSNGEEAVRLVREILPDVILMDINLPKMNGLEATRLIHSEFPQIRIVILSMYEDPDDASAALSVGASAFLSKSGSTDKLLAAVRNKVEWVFSDNAPQLFHSP